MTFSMNNSEIVFLLNLITRYYLKISWLSQLFLQNIKERTRLYSGHLQFIQSVMGEDQALNK